MSRKLIFDHTLRGHHVEYFHHLYLEALKNTQHEYIFAYPKSSEAQLSVVTWPSSNHIKFYSYTDNFNKNGNIFYQAYCYTNRLKSVIKMFKPESVTIMDAFSCLPFVSFIRHTKINSLVGGIYLYTWKDDSIIKRIQDIIKYFLFSRMNTFHNIYIQSDAPAAYYLNKKFRTRKFKYICDPVPRLSVNVKNLREDLGITPDKTIILHPGDLSKRKGTIEMLRGINACDEQTLSSYHFVLAGRISPAINDEFFDLLNSIKKKCNCMSFIEGFVEFDYLASLVNTCDILFLPYSLTNQSSGIVGYGAEYHKPVVVSKSGLLAKIVRRYKLGYIIQDTSVDCISHFFTEQKFDWKYRPNNYLKDNSVEEFARTFLSD